jgi:hypothetical protein
VLTRDFTIHISGLLSMFNSAKNTASAASAAEGVNPHIDQTPKGRGRTTRLGVVIVFDGDRRTVEVHHEKDPRKWYPVHIRVLRTDHIFRTSQTDRTRLLHTQNSLPTQTSHHLRRPRDGSDTDDGNCDGWPVQRRAREVIS